MTYLFNLWQPQTVSEPVAPVFRSDNRKQFIRATKRYFKENKLTHYRVIRVNQNLTILSAPVTDQAKPIYNWYHMEFVKQPEHIEYFNFKHSNKIIIPE